jgi:hypothetical protein
MFVCVGGGYNFIRRQIAGPALSNGGIRDKMDSILKDSVGA